MFSMGDLLAFLVPQSVADELSVARMSLYLDGAG
jgi:hypothetical protein